MRPNPSSFASCVGESIVVTMMMALVVRMTASRAGNILDVGIKHFGCPGSLSSDNSSGL